MSTREIQQFIYQLGLFIFSDGHKDEGMIVARYNIREGKVEYFFIPAGNVLAYRSARSQHDLDAHRKLGVPLDVSSVSSAHLITS
ncbi:MAG: hypothetical protein RL021_722 [Bacteroidota bacterium]|jgi:hypothetical protein